MRRGQTILETVLAVFFVTLLFMGLFELSLKLNKRIVLDYAAQRVARARAVGLNDFMCRKTANIATISIAGERTWPRTTDGVPISTAIDLGRIPIYLESEDYNRARAILDYDLWQMLKFTAENSGGIAPEVSATIHSPEDRMSGAAKVESHYPYYLNAL